MKLTKVQLDEIFSFQKNKPLIVTEENLEDLEVMVKYAKSNIDLVVGSEVFKFFVEKNEKYTIYYVSGYDNLMDRVDIVLRKSLKVYTNGGIPIFVEG